MGTIERDSENLRNVAIASAGTMADVLAKLMDALSEKSKRADCDMYRIYGEDYYDTFKELLEASGIPYLESKEENIIIIEKSQKDAVSALNMDMLLQKSNYYMEVNADSFENAMAGINGNVFAIDDITETQKDMLIRSCGNISKGFTIGTREEDGKYDLIIRADKVFSMEPHANDFCKAYLEATIYQYGQVGSLHLAQYEEQRELEKRIYQDRGINETLYVVDLKNRSHYIEMSQKGFESHRCDEGSNPFNNEGYKVEVTAAGYWVEFERQISDYRQMEIMTDKMTVEEFLRGKEPSLEREHTEIKGAAKRHEIGEIKLVEGIDKLARELMRNKSSNMSNAKEAFNAYKNSVKEVIAALSKGESIKEYEVDCKLLKEICQKFDLKAEKYNRLERIVNKVEAENFKARTFEELDKDKGSDNYDVGSR